MAVGMDLLIDDSGDLVIKDGDFVAATGPDEVGQRLTIRLTVNLGEWFLDPTLGLRYLDDSGDPTTILSKNPNIPAIVASIKKVIVETDGVVRLVSFTEAFSNSTRQFDVTFTVEVVDGTLVEVAVAVDNAATFPTEGAAIAIQFQTIIGALTCQD